MKKTLEEIYVKASGGKASPASSIKARPFSKSDWYGYAGAERPSEHQAPLIAEREHPNGHSWVAVADKGGLTVLHHDKGGDYKGYHQLDVPFEAAKHLIEPAINAKSNAHLKEMGFKYHSNSGTGSDEPPSLE